MIISDKIHVLLRVMRFFIDLMQPFKKIQMKNVSLIGRS